MTSMVGIARGELVRIRRPSVLALAAAAVVVISTLATALTIFAASDAPGATSGPTVGVATTLDELAGPGGLSRGFALTSSFVGFLIFLSFAGAHAADHTTGMIRMLLVREPRRARLFAGRFAALLLVVAGAEIVALAVSVATAFPAAAARGLPTGPWTSFSALAGVGQSLGDGLLVALCYGALGVALGSLTKSAVIALGVGVAWVMPIEHILAMAWSDAGQWLPGLVIDAVAIGGNSVVSFPRAAATGSIYAGLALAAYLIVFRRRDVAD